MLVIMRNGAHLKTMKLFHAIATGKTVTMESDKIQEWEEIFSLLQTKGIT